MRSVSTTKEIPRIRPVYLVPKDGAPKPQFPVRLQRAAQHAQIWYRGQSPNKRTFSVAATPALTVRLENDAQWYTTFQPGFDPKLNFWFNILEEMKRRLNADFNDDENTWLFYADIDARGQATGASSGIVLIDEGDVAGLLGLGEQPPCRWIGSLGHELGHAFGLSHPVKCAVSPTLPQCQSLMYTGYRNYPKTTLLETDRKRLLQSAFFSLLPGSIKMVDCARL